MDITEKVNNLLESASEIKYMLMGQSFICERYKLKYI